MSLNNDVWEILKWPDPRLQIVCEEIDPLFFGEPMGEMFDKMWRTLKAFMGYGLAAPQIGIPNRALIVQTPKGCKIELINPEIVRAWGGRFMSEESCLSYPGKTVKVMRHRQVKVKGLDRDGEPVVFGGKQLQAAALQHEIEHLDGINLADYAEGRRK